MKKILIPLILLFSLSVYAQQNEKTKIDSLKNEINSLSTIVKTNSVAIDSLNKALKNQTITFDIKDWDNKKKVFDKSTDWLAIILQCLALLIPIVVAIFAGFIALYQVKKQGKISLAQTRANNISQARINWIEELRKNLSEYIGLVALLNYYMSEVVLLHKAKKDEESEKIYNSQIERICNLRQISAEIALRLNSSEAKHNKLEKEIEEYEKKCVSSYKNVTDENVFSEITSKILISSKGILKDAWEQAKNEGNSEIK